MADSPKEFSSAPEKSQAGGSGHAAPDSRKSLTGVPPHCSTRIYDGLVKREDDIVGLLAYGIYQMAKCEYMKQQYDENKSYLSIEDLAKYDNSFVQDDLRRLRRDAEEKLINLAKSPVLNARFEGELVKLNEKIDKITGYRHHVVGHIAGFASLVVIAVLVTAAARHEPSLGTVLEYLANLFKIQ